MHWIGASEMINCRAVIHVSVRRFTLVTVDHISCVCAYDELLPTKWSCISLDDLLSLYDYDACFCISITCGKIVFAVDAWIRIQGNKRVIEHWKISAQLFIQKYAYDILCSVPYRYNKPVIFQLFQNYLHVRSPLLCFTFLCPFHQHTVYSNRTNWF